MAAKMALIKRTDDGRAKSVSFDANLKLHTNYDANYAVSGDGQRFLGIARESQSGGSDIQMVLNWPSLVQ